MADPRPHATNLVVWQAALAMVIAIGGVGVGIVYFIAGIDTATSELGLIVVLSGAGIIS